MNAVQVFKMGWYHKSFDIMQNDSQKAHLDVEKGKSILRKVAVDPVSEELMQDQETLEKSDNCVYDLFEILASGEFPNCSIKYK